MNNVDALKELLAARRLGHERVDSRVIAAAWDAAATYEQEQNPGRVHPEYVDYVIRDVLPYLRAEWTEHATVNRALIESNLQEEWSRLMMIKQPDDDHPSVPIHQRLLEKVTAAVNQHLSKPIVLGQPLQFRPLYEQ